MTGFINIMGTIFFLGRLFVQDMGIRNVSVKFMYACLTTVEKTEESAVWQHGFWNVQHHLIFCLSLFEAQPPNTTIQHL